MLRLDSRTVVVNMTGLPIEQAAAELGVSVPTLRRWMRQGAPVAARGRRGRGHVALIDPAEVRAWQARRGPTDDAGQLLADLQRDAPGLAVDAALQAIAEHSLSCQTGAESRLLRRAVAEAGRRFADALTKWTANKLTDG